MKYFSTVFALLFLLVSVLLSGCATLFSGSRQTIRITGCPSGSTISVNDKPAVVRAVPGNPNAVTVRLPRKHNAEIKVHHDGYKDYTEVLYPDKVNGITYANYGFTLLLFNLISREKDARGYSVSTINYPSFIGGLVLPLVGAGIDAVTGASRKFSKTVVNAPLTQLPRTVSGSQSVQAGTISVRTKAGEKLGNLLINNQTTDILYFGKTLDVNADNLSKNVNSSLKDLGYTVPSSESRGVFDTAPTARYTVQGDMRDIHYDIYATYAGLNSRRYETRCTVEVTWKLLNQSRQTVAEQKLAGSSIKFEEGGSTAFEDAFENSLFAFLDQPAVKDALAKGSAPAAILPAAAAPAPAAGQPAAAAAEKLAAISIHRAAPLKQVGDNGLAAAAQCVAIIETAEGHGSGCLISADGYLVTNAHVVGAETTVKVHLPDGIETTGQVVRVNTDLDLALVKVAVDGLKGFQLPTASTAEIGADVFAIGTPADKELGQSVTKGIISGRRKIEGHTLLQTDVSINGGNSGGALVTRAGQLLGIVNAKLVGRGIEGIGFAIPAEQVAEALQLKIVD